MIQTRYLYQANRKVAFLILAFLTFTSIPWHAKSDTPEEGASEVEYHQKAEAHFQNAEYETALSIWQLIVDSFPESELSPQIYLRLGQCLYELKKYEQAREWFQKLVYKFPTPESLGKLVSDLRNYWAGSYFHERKYDQALETFIRFSVGGRMFLPQIRRNDYVKEFKPENVEEWWVDLIGLIGLNYGWADRVDDLIALLKDQDSYIRMKTAVVLGEIAEKSADKKFLQPAIAPLITALKDEDVTIRANAAVALGNIGEVKAVEPLIAALKDQNESVRRNAVATLGQIGDAKAAEPLLAILKAQDRYGRMNVIKALEQIGDRCGIDAVKEYIFEQLFQEWRPWSILERIGGYGN